MSRGISLAVIVVVTCALVAVWWVDRGRDHGVRRVEAPAPVAVVPAPAEAARPAVTAGDVAWLADDAERAAVVALAAAIDGGGPFAHPDDGAAYDDRGGHLPARPPRYWRAFAGPGGAPRLVVSGARGELYYTRDGVAFTALRGALP